MRHISEDIFWFTQSIAKIVDFNRLRISRGFVSVALGKRGREEKALGRAKHIAACFREKDKKRSAFCFLPDPWCVALGPHRGRLVDQEPIFSLLDGAEK